MLAAVFSTTFRTLGARWAAILGAVLASVVLTLVVMLLVLVPAMHSLTTPAIKVPAKTMVDPATGASVPDPSAGTLVVTPNSGDPSTWQTSTQPGLTSNTVGAGAVIKLLVAFAVVLALSISTATTGVFAAAGMGPMEALREGARTSPHAIVQSVRLTWPGLVAYVAGFLAILALHAAGALLAVPLILGGMYLLLRSSGTVWLAVGAIAHGHVEWSPDAARAAAEGRRWTATGVGMVGTIAAALLNFIPLVGPIFISAFTSAMWEEFDGGSGPSDPSEAPAPIAPVSVVEPPAPAAAAIPQLVAGPTWNGVASSAAPMGSWIDLARAAKVGVQVQWTTGAAPVIHLADQAGTWRAPAEQPAESGGTTWIDLPQGLTWVAMVPADAAATQQLWVASWMPGDAAPAAAAAA
jgi:hypothetical protein